MFTTYDLLTEPWIPARDPTGSLQELGLREVLARAHELTDLVDAAPPLQFGLYRLLIALVMDAYAIRTRDDLEAHLEEDRFDLSGFDAYVERIGRNRFDLFDAEHPFLQSGPPPEDETDGTPVAALFFHLPSGTNVTHFHHRLADAHAVAPAVCARALCAVAPFMTAGGAGYSPSINGTPPWYILVRGRSLRETILLNTFVLHDLELTGCEPPAWASTEPVVPKQTVPCRSLLQGLTWRPRQVRFLPGRGGRCTYTGRESAVLVRRMTYGPGLKFEGSNWTDPQVPYRMTEKGRFGIRPEEEREIWRDLGPILLLRRGDFVSERNRAQYERPLVVEQLVALREARVLPREDRVMVEAYGMRADKAKVFEWRYERLTLPSNLTESPFAGRLVQTAMEKADDVASALRIALKITYPRDAEGNKNALDRLIQTTQMAYWSRLHSIFHTNFLPAVAGLASDDIVGPQAVLEEWRAALKGVGREMLQRATDGMDSNAEALARQVRAGEYFSRMLRKYLDPDVAGAGGKKERGKRAT